MALSLGFDPCVLLASLIRLLCSELGHQILSHSSVPHDVLQLLQNPVSLQVVPSKEVRTAWHVGVYQVLTIRSRDLLQALAECGRDNSSSQFWVRLDLCCSRLNEVSQVPYGLDLLGRQSRPRPGNGLPTCGRRLSSRGEWVVLFSHIDQAYQARESSGLLVGHLTIDVGQVNSRDGESWHTGGGQGADERLALDEGASCQLRLRGRFVRDLDLVEPGEACPFILIRDVARCFGVYCLPGVGWLAGWLCNETLRPQVRV